MPKVKASRQSSRISCNNASAAPTSLAFRRKFNQDVWETMLGRLKEFKQLNGHCNVPQVYPQDEALGCWIKHQRTTLKDTPADNPRRQKLENIGFVWQIVAREERSGWEKKFQRLLAYERLHGHCNVPQRYPEDKSLGLWVKLQRQRLQEAPADNPRRKKLDSIGFTWKVVTGRYLSQTLPYDSHHQPIKVSWDEMFLRLQDYKRLYGNCNVPQYFLHDKALGLWVMRQRVKFKNAPAEKLQRQKLDSIGFKWQIRVLSDSWDEMFERLQEYMSVHGHCRVPSSYPPDESLACWVENQQHRLRNAPADNPRRLKLESIGFIFRTGRMQEFAFPVPEEATTIDDEPGNGAFALLLTYGTGLRRTDQRVNSKNAPVIASMAASDTEDTDVTDKCV